MKLVLIFQRVAVRPVFVGSCGILFEYFLFSFFPIFLNTLYL